MTWLGLLGAGLVVAAASGWMWHLRRDQRGRRARRDPHWGDWPPDQMAP